MVEMYEKRIIVREEGRFTIPHEIRQELGIKENSVLEISIEDEKIVITVVKR